MRLVRRHLFAVIWFAVVWFAVIAVVAAVAAIATFALHPKNRERAEARS